MLAVELCVHDTHYYNYNYLLLTDIDECALSSTNPCQQNCTNSIGDFDCSCQEGFNQNGFLCEG